MLLDYYSIDFSAQSYKTFNDSRIVLTRKMLIMLLENL